VCDQAAFVVYYVHALCNAAAARTLLASAAPPSAPSSSSSTSSSSAKEGGEAAAAAAAAAAATTALQANYAQAASAHLATAEELLTAAVKAVSTHVDTDARRQVLEYLPPGTAIQLLPSSHAMSAPDRRKHCGRRNVPTGRRQARTNTA